MLIEVATANDCGTAPRAMADNDWRLTPASRVPTSFSKSSTELVFILSNGFIRNLYHCFRRIAATFAQYETCVFAVQSDQPFTDTRHSVSACL